MTVELMGPKWFQLLQEEFKQDYFLSLKAELGKEYKTVKVYPAPKNIFRAFQLTDPETVKVIILLQDPYPFTDSEGRPHADGLALSSPSAETPASLRTVLREVDRDVIKTNTLKEFRECFPANNLMPWASQGVLLLNTALTVRAGVTNSHQGIGWNIFIKNVLQHIANDDKHKVFCLWGGNAKNLAKEITFSENHKILEAGHPATASHGKDLYSGCNHFSKINYYFWRNEIQEINWKLNGQEVHRI
jgi:uracil-DNA glycosylase